VSTKCHLCGRDITENEETDSKFVRCSECNQFTPKGNSDSKKVKGGKNRMTEKKSTTAKKKTEAAPAKEKVVKEKKIKVGEVRESNAKTIYTYMTEDLKISKEEVKPTLSRLYNLLTKKKI
jgi:DNA-directed RNA polymerase subunit M/transcription elongation factor TFIIS